MVTKTFRASNMLLALQQVKRELGNDAIVVSMRTVPGGAPWQVWRSPIVEVVAMKKSQAPSKKTKSTPKPAPSRQKSTINIASAITANELQGVDDQDQKRDVYNDLSVTDTIRSLSQIKKPQKTGEWRPFNPPRVSKTPANFPAASSDTAPVFIHADVIEPASPELNGPAQGSTGSEAIKALFEKLPADQPQSVADKPQENKGRVEQILALLETRNERGDSAPEPVLPSALHKAQEQLLRQGMENELVSRFINTCKEVLPPQALEDNLRVRYMLQRQLEAEIRVFKKEDVFSSNPLFVIGSSGAGKTSICGKLAALAAHTYNKKVVWVCADTFRMGAIAEARTYTDLLNIPLRLAYTPEELEEIIRQESAADWILVDTTDCNPRSEKSVAEVGSFVTQISSRSTFLVLSAMTKNDDLRQILAAFSPFRVRGLVVTRMDETLSFGNIYNTAWHSQMPLAFFSAGHHLFYDLQAASAQILVDALFDEGIAK